MPSQTWRYRHIEGVGDDVKVQFVDWDNSGRLRMTRDADFRLLLEKPGDPEVVRIEVPCAKPVTIYGRILTPSGSVVQVFQDSVSNPGTYVKRVSLPAGSYRLIIARQDPRTGAASVSEKNLTVPRARR